MADPTPINPTVYTTYTTNTAIHANANAYEAAKVSLGLAVGTLDGVKYEAYQGACIEHVLDPDQRQFEEWSEIIYGRCTTCHNRITLPVNEQSEMVILVENVVAGLLGHIGEYDGEQFQKLADLEVRLEEHRARFEDAASLLSIMKKKMAATLMK